MEPGGSADVASAGETIAALSSPAGASAQALLRVSGPAALRRLAAIAASGAEGLERARGFTTLALDLRLAGAVVPARLLVCRGPRSYTAEDLVEVSLPGSPALLGLALRALLATGDVRPARPGEFTLRAFLNGRIDLSQAESVATLIAAGSVEEARASSRALRGELRHRIEEIAAGVVESVALLEAALDFADEDIEEVAPAAMLARVDGVREEIAALRRSSRLRTATGGGLRVVIVGFPNAGKSSLLNALVGEPAAIASSLAGTTRDPVRAVTSSEGRRIEWVDLAGTLDIEELLGPATGVSGPSGGSDGAVESDDALREDGAGAVWSIVRRLSRLELEAADRILWVHDPLAATEASLAAFERLDASRRLLVVQKMDRLDADARARLESLGRARGASPRPLLVSAWQRLGLDRLVRSVLAGGSGDGAREASPVAEAPPRFLLSAHQEAALSLAQEALERAAAGLRSELGYEFAAADLRDAARALEDFTGKMTADAILGHVFSRFCVGK